MHVFVCETRWGGVNTRRLRRVATVGVTGCLSLLFGLPVWTSAALAESLCTTAPTQCLASLPRGPADSLVSYLLIGSSNMMGRALPTAEDSLSHPRVVSMDLGYGGWKQTTEPAMPHPNIGAMAGHSMALAFGKALADEFTDEYVGLVCCGQSGKNLQSYAQPHFGQTSAWGSILGYSNDGTYVGTWGNDRDIIAEASDQGARWGGIVVVAVPYAVLDTTTFGPILKQIADSSRTWLGDHSIPFLVHEPAPYQIQVMGGAGTLGNAYRRVVHSIDTLVSNSGWVRTDDLLNLEDSGEPAASDQVNLRTHFCRTSNMTLAQRFADALIALRAASVEGRRQAGGMGHRYAVEQGRVALIPPCGRPLDNVSSNKAYDLRGRVVPRRERPPASPALLEVSVGP